MAEPGMSEPEETSDVVPKWAIQLLMALWLLLLGVRWLITPFLMLGDPAIAEQVVGLDRGLLLRCYQMLLVVTLLVPALRLVRRVQKSPDSTHDKEVHST